MRVIKESGQQQESEKAAKSKPRIKWVSWIVNLVLAFLGLY